MRLHHIDTEFLAEKTDRNMQVLRDCVAVVLDWLPMQLPARETFDTQFSDLGGFRRLLKTYEGSPYEAALKALGSVRLFINNKYKAVRTAGYYNSTTRVIGFNLAVLFGGEVRPVSKQDLLALRLPELPIKSFRAVVLHELRHFFQEKEYGGYYNRVASDDAADYRKSKLEIDAAWHHHLEDFDPKAFPSAADYAQKVMASFAAYKSLSPKELEHYRRKTVMFYQNTMKAAGADPLHTDARTKLAANRQAIKTFLLDALAKTDTKDMRHLPGYDPEARNFFFPDRVFRSVSATLMKGAPVAPGVAPILMLGIALALDGKAAGLNRYIQVVYKVGLEDALAHGEHSFANGYDWDAIRAFLVAAYR